MSLPLVLGLVYLFSELLLTVTRRSRDRSGVRQDRSTLRTLWIVILVSIAAGLYVAAHARGAALPHGRAFPLVGLLLFVPGLVVRWLAIIQLGRFFTVDVTIATDHELVEHGLYRWVRHPSYSGLLMAFVGFAFSLGNWLSILVITVPIFAAFFHRINVEEQALLAALGDRYAAYMRRTQRLVSFLY